MTYYVSSGTVNPTHSLTDDRCVFVLEKRKIADIGVSIRRQRRLKKNLLTIKTVLFLPLVVNADCQLVIRYILFVQQKLILAKENLGCCGCCKHKECISDGLLLYILADEQNWKKTVAANLFVCILLTVDAAGGFIDKLLHTEVKLCCHLYC